MKKVFLLLLFVITLSLIYGEDYLEYTGCGLVKSIITKSVKEEFLKEHPDTQIEVVGKGDLYGIREATSGIVDLGGSCRHKLDVAEEKYANMIPFAWDGIVAIVHKDNPLKNISSNQLKKVLTGEISNWKELNGENVAINLYIRKGKNNGIGRMTRELLFADPNVEYSSKATRLAPITPLEPLVMKDKYGIAVTGVYSARAKKGLNIVKLDNVSPTNENIRTAKYPLFRPLYLAYSQEDASEITQDFIDLIVSDKGQSLLRKDGVVSLSDAKDLWGKFEKKMKKAGQNIILLK